MKERPTKSFPEICKHCRYWDSRDGEVGECKRFPPKLVKIDEEWGGARPATEWKDSCGEFKMRVDA
jgi:hypothetical protein